MAVRVRKLARQLGRSPADVLRLLHALGYTRYRSAEDMVSDAVARRAAAAVRQGVSARPVQPRAARVREPARSAPPAGEDLMARLVPGVVPYAGRERHRAPPRELPGADRESRSDEPGPGEASEASEEDHRALQAALDTVRAERDALRALVDELERGTEALQREVDALRAARDAGGDALVDVLRARGLVGRDEQVSALAGLLAVRALDPAWLRVGDRAALERALAERLVLFGGEVPERLTGKAGVSVAMDRADLPAARALDLRLERAGELLMLHGLRRVRAAGVPPAWHRWLIEGIDPRISVDLVPGGPRDGERARSDAAGVDVLWLWDVHGDEDAERAWSEAAVVARGPARPDAALDALIGALEAR